MIIDIWKPIFKGSGTNRQTIEYILYDLDEFYMKKQKGYVFRYLCDTCKSDKLFTSTTSVLLDDRLMYNTLNRQTCRSCRSRISEYETKKTQVPFVKIKNSFKESDYLLLTTEIEYDDANNKSQMKLISICSKKHQYKCSWNNWSKGKRCRKCYDLDIVEYNKKYKSKFSLYKHLVVRESNKNYKLHTDIINDKNLLRSSQYHLDHIYSIYDGFFNNIPVYLMSSIQNLRIIESSVNLSKNRKSDITIDELIDKYNKYNSTTI